MNAKPIIDKLKYTGTYILFILLISLSLTVISLDSFTSEENLKSYYTDVIYKDSNIHEKAPDKFDGHYQNCLQGELYQNLDFEDENKSISCEVVLKTTKEGYADEIIKEVIFKEQYDKTFTCTFLQCLTKKETSLVVLTEQGHDFMSNTKLFLILGTIIGALLLAVLSKSIFQGLYSFAIIFLVIGANYFIIKVMPSMPITQQGYTFDAAVTTRLLAQPIMPITLTLFILGIILLTAAIILKIKTKKE